MGQPLNMSPHQTDIVLLEQLKAGDTAAFANFYGRYRKYLMVVAVSLLNDEMEAQDMVQDFFVDFWQKRLFDKIDPGYNKGEGEVIRYYIHRIIYNRCMDRISRRKSRKRGMDSMPAQDPGYMPESRMEVEEWQQQIGTALQAAINKVPPLSAEVFRLAYIQHKSRQEIAIQMGVSPHTVKNQLLRAMKILRSNLKKG